MITSDQASKVALRQKSGYYITNAVKYGEYYVFFMQPKGVSPDSDEAEMESYVFVNYNTGKVEYKSIYMFRDFALKAKPISVR